MKQLTIKRVGNNEDGVYGVILDNNVPFCVSLEDQWRDNQKDKSCIPAGTYLCKRVFSNKWQTDTFEVIVQERTYIRFHPGNTEKDTRGCIMPGEEFGVLRAIDDDTNTEELQTAILSSGRAFLELMNKLKNEQTFLLKIIWV